MEKEEAQDYSFGIVIAWTILILILASKKKISVRHLDRFRKLLQQLIAEEKYSTAADLLEPQVQLLEKVEAKNFIGSLIYEKISGWDPHPFFSIEENRPHRFLKHFARFSIFFPSGEENRATVWAIQKEISNSTKFVGYLASKRSRTSFLFAKVGGWQRSNYISKLFEALLDDQSSDFYQECNTTFVSSLKLDVFDADSKPFLATFLNDPIFAEQISIWKDPGDYILRLTNQHANSKYANFLNSPAVDIDRESIKDPLFTTINFFHIMVLRALACDVGYHMWLYYLDHFVGNLIRLYDDTGDSVDPEAEHPIRSAYFIWVILRALTNVIESSRHLPEYSTHLQISKPDGSHQNDNIPKSAAICISGCLRSILKAPNVGNTFKIYCAEIVLGCLRKTKGFERSPNLFLAFKDSILRPFGTDDWAYRDQLRIAFEGIDHVISFELDEFREALGL